MWGKVYIIQFYDLQGTFQRLFINDSHKSENIFWIVTTMYKEHLTSEEDSEFLLILNFICFQQIFRKLNDYASLKDDAVKACKQRNDFKILQKNLSHVDSNLNCWKTGNLCGCQSYLREGILNPIQNLDQIYESLYSCVIVQSEQKTISCQLLLWSKTWNQICIILVKACRILMAGKIHISGHK
jgi:hypothetical protein